MRTTELLFTVCVGAVLAAGSLLVLRATDSRRGSPPASSDARWSARLADDSVDPFDDDDDDDAPTDAIVAGPVAIELRHTTSSLPVRPVLLLTIGEPGDCAMRGPPRGAQNEDSQDSDDDDDDDDDAPSAVVSFTPIEPIDLDVHPIIPEYVAAASVVDVDVEPLRGPPSLTAVPHPPLRAPP